MFYECYNKIGEKIGVARTKREAEEMTQYANWLLDQQKGTPEYKQRVERAQRVQEKENNETGAGVIAAIIFLVVCFIIMALS